jgi:hypothetical protein
MTQLFNIDPLKGFLTGLASFAVGITPEVSAAAQPQLIQLSDGRADAVYIVQMIAFTVTIIAGILTAVNGCMRIWGKSKRQ